MDIKAVTIGVNEYNQMLMSSVLRALKWLDVNVLSKNIHDGYYLRQRLTEGIIFDDDSNRYLINSYLHWKTLLAARAERETERRRGREFTGNSQFEQMSGPGSTSVFFTPGNPSPQGPIPPSFNFQGPTSRVPPRRGGRNPIPVGSYPSQIPTTSNNGTQTSSHQTNERDLSRTHSDEQVDAFIHYLTSLLSTPPKPSEDNDGKEDDKKNDKSTDDGISILDLFKTLSSGCNDPTCANCSSRSQQSGTSPDQDNSKS